MAQGKALSEDIKATVAAALISGLSVSEAARQYKLPTSTVSRIKAALPMNLERLGADTRENLDDIIVSHVLANISGLNRITKQTHNDGWITLQSAEGLAKLYGEIADHTIRLLEAASAVQPDAKPE